MRRYVFALLSALALAGCTKDMYVEEPAPEMGVEISICVSGSGEDGTRAFLDGTAVKFQPGDKISVFDGNGRNCEFTQTGEIGADGSATFKGKVGLVADSYLVLYPYMPDVEISGSTIGTIGTDEVRRPVIVPKEQTAVEDGFDPDAFISVAKSERLSNSVHSITFNGACALVKFTLPDDLDGFTFEKAVLESENMLAGAVTLNHDGTGKYVGPGSASVTLAGTMKAGRSYYFCTLAHDIKGISLSLYHYPSDSEPVVVKASASDRSVSLVRNRVLDLGTINVSDLPSKDAGWYGEGTSTDPYQISTVGDMQLLLSRLADQASYRGLYYRLTDDIDAGGESFIEDGRNVEFCGVFDGNGHAISNYTGSGYNEPYSTQQPNNLYDYYGLFHRVYRATFRNLTLMPADMIAVLHSYNYVSPFIAVVDPANGTPTQIENCRIDGSCNLAFCNWGDVNFGGFVGFSYSDGLIFKNCINDADYTFSEYVYSRTDEEWHTYEYGVAAGANYNIGGFIGCMYNKNADSTTDFDRCRNRGDITLDMDIAGGHVHGGGFIGKGDWGFIYANTFVFTNCVNSGKIEMDPGEESGSVCSSGFVGISEIDGLNHYGTGDIRHLPAPHFHNCLNKGDITARGNNTYAAGFAFCRKPTGNGVPDYGTNDNTQFRLCINIGTISGASAAAIGSAFGNCRWCWMLDSDPMLPITISGNPGAGISPTNVYPYYCMHYPTINADTPNNRRTGSDGKGGTDVVLNEYNSQWNSAQWKSLTAAWVGGSRDRSLDLDF